jgi:hypothetical protein
MNYLKIDAVTRVIFFIGLILLTCSLAFDYHLYGIYSTNPISPNVVTQQIVPYHLRSTVVYVTPSEFATLQTVHNLEIAGLIVVGFSIIIRRVNRSRNQR